MTNQMCIHGENAGCKQCEQAPSNTMSVLVLDLPATDVLQRGWLSSDNLVCIEQAKAEGHKLFVKLEDFERLRQRCHPSKVVMIGETGHYVSEAVSAEIERLRRAITSAMDHLSNGDTEGGARALRECFWGTTHEPPADEQIDHAIKQIEECELSMDDSEGLVAMLTELKQRRASQPPRTLPEVGGDTLPVSLAQFEQRCKVLLADEQEKLSPDNALIGLLCDAVRLARENERMGTAGITPPPSPALIETAPQDGTPILGWAADYGWRETKSVTFQPGSPGHARGDTSRWWTWDEPVCNWAHRWKPTHWMPLPEGPTSTKESAP